MRLAPLLLLLAACAAPPVIVEPDAIAYSEVIPGTVVTFEAVGSGLPIGRFSSISSSDEDGQVTAVYSPAGTSGKRVRQPARSGPYIGHQDENDQFKCRYGPYSSQLIQAK